MKLYLVELVNTDGSTQVVTAFGLDSICGLLPTVKYGELKQEFSPKIQKEWAKLMSRPTGLLWTSWWEASPSAPPRRARNPRQCSGKEIKVQRWLCLEQNESTTEDLKRPAFLRDDCSHQGGKIQYR